MKDHKKVTVGISAWDLDGSLDNVIAFLEDYRRQASEADWKDVQLTYEFEEGFLLAAWRPMTSQEKDAAKRKKIADNQRNLREKKKKEKKEREEYERLKKKYEE